MISPVERGIAAAATICLGFTAGCSSHETAVSDRPRMVDVQGFPKQLPAAVAAEIPNVVAVQETGVDDKQIQTGVASGNSGSGISIGNGLYISAGHVVLSDDGQERIGGNDCGALEIDTPMNVPHISGIGLPAVKHVASFASDINSPLPDISLIETATMQHLNSSPSIVRISSALPKLGEKLYSVNYESDPAGNQRTPLASRLNTPHRRAGLSKPAIFGLVAYGQLKSGYIAAVSHIKGYMPPAYEDTTRGGSSGGPDFNSKGELVGITVRATVIAKQMIQRDLGITFEGLNSQDVQVTLIQRITPAVIDRYKQRFAQQAACKE